VDKDMNKDNTQRSTRYIFRKLKMWIEIGINIGTRIKT